MAGIKSKKEIGALFKKGKRASGKLLNVRYFLREEGRPRSLFVVSKKAGGAVKRNRIRRRIKEAWRKIRERILPGSDLAFFPRDGAGEAKTNEFYCDMERIFKREKILDQK